MDNPWGLYLLMTCIKRVHIQSEYGMGSTHYYLCVFFQIFPGLILSDIKPAKKMKFKTVCYLLVQLMHCRKMFKAEIPFSNVMNCEDGDKVCLFKGGHTALCVWWM